MKKVLKSFSPAHPPKTNYNHRVLFQECLHFVVHCPYLFLKPCHWYHDHNNNFLRNVVARNKQMYSSAKDEILFLPSIAPKTYWLFFLLQTEDSTCLHLNSYRQSQA